MTRRTIKNENNLKFLDLAELLPIHIWSKNKLFFIKMLKNKSAAHFIITPVTITNKTDLWPSN